MTEPIDILLAEDLEQLREGLDGFSSYEFASDLQARMKALELSSLALGGRCGLSHTIVDKWRQGKAKPNSKERMKELGMALSMKERELNSFLFQNGYPKLYAKNPLDSAAKLLLMNSAGREDIVWLYRDLIERLGLSDYAPSGDNNSLKTCVMSAELREAAENGQLSAWFQEHKKDFTGGARLQLPDLQIARFILFYLGDSTIHEMTVTGELPVNLKNLLYTLVGGRAVHVRGLREKLIAFGLYADMTEEEIDTLLDCARLRPITEPASTADLALLMLLRIAHERYPYYEAENLSRIVERLSASPEPYDRALLSEYRARQDNAGQRTAYYDRHERTADEFLFEQTYTSYCDRGIMDYVRDAMRYLIEDNLIKPEQANPLLALLERKQEGELLIWQER
ncbi:MAG: hypothetical protein PHN73_07475 [Eubacteriales bacterium]|nr:hypothetical protein [Eubacteriales bacterium]